MIEKIHKTLVLKYTIIIACILLLGFAASYIAYRHNGIKLLEDTLTFVKDFEVENGSLPQTGSAFGSEMLLGLGGLLTASGALLRRKRK